MKSEERDWLRFLKKKDGKDDPQITAELERDRLFEKKRQKDKKIKQVKEETDKKTLKLRIKKGIKRLRG